MEADPVEDEPAEGVRSEADPLVEAGLVEAEAPSEVAEGHQTVQQAVPAAQVEVLLAVPQEIAEAVLVFPEGDHLGGIDPVEAEAPSEAAEGYQTVPQAGLEGAVLVDLTGGVFLEVVTATKDHENRQLLLII